MYCSFRNAPILKKFYAPKGILNETEGKYGKNY